MSTEPIPTEEGTASGAAPAPPPASHRRTGMIAGSIVVVAGLVVGVLAIAGVFSGGRAPHAPRGAIAASRPTVHGAAAATHVDALDASSGTVSCGGDLYVGPNTSCSFAANVEGAYDTSSGGASYVYVYSPATGQNYQMYCTGDLPHVCTGGAGASVYFTSGPGGSIPTDTTNCGSSVFAGPNTSCDFAENVEQAYAGSGSWGDATVYAYSPATSQTYQMYCSSGSPHLCTGGNSASVYFP